MKHYYKPKNGYIIFFENFGYIETAEKSEDIIVRLLNEETWFNGETSNWFKTTQTKQDIMTLVEEGSWEEFHPIT